MSDSPPVPPAFLIDREGLLAKKNVSLTQESGILPVKPTLYVPLRRPLTAYIELKLFSSSLTAER